MHLHPAVVVLFLALTVGAGAVVAEEPALTGESARLAALGPFVPAESKALMVVWQEGLAWTAEQAQAARSRLASDPRDLASRLRLAAFTSTRPEAAKEHRDLLVGLVEHHAADPIGGALGEFLPHGTRDKTAWNDAWRAEVRARSDSALVLANAGLFLMSSRGQAAEQEGRDLLLRAHALAPDEWKWTAALASDATRQVRVAEGEWMSPAAARDALRILLKLEKTTPPSPLPPVWPPPEELPRSIAQAALRAGDLEEAERRARAVLATATPKGLSWDYGNVVHEMQMVLGAAALVRGDVETAKRHLLEAGRTPGSPQLDSFGPKFALARDLLAKGEKAAVLDYLELCAKFWEMGRDRLEEWRKTIEAGGTPDFGLRAKPPVRPTEKPESGRLPPSAGKPDGLVGLWESAERSKGGIGGAMELRADGTATMGLVVRVEMEWTREGDHLKFSTTEKGDPVTLPLGRVEGDAWSTPGPDGKEMKKQRVGKPFDGADPLLGIWKYVHYAGGTAYERYDTTGWMYFRLAMPGVRQGKWSSESETLLLTVEGQPEEKLSATIRDDWLSLVDEAGKKREYRFAGRTAWYPLGDTK